MMRPGNMPATARRETQMWTEDKDNCDASERVAGTESPLLLALENISKGGRQAMHFSPCIVSV